MALPFFGLVVYSEYNQARDAVNGAGNSTLNLAEIAASSTEQFLQDSEALLKQLAPRARAYVTKSATCDSFQGDFSNIPPQYTVLEVIDISGQPLCATAPPLTNTLQSVADRQWFQNVLCDNKFTVSEPLLGRITGKWSVVLGYPLDDDSGQIIGVLSVSIVLARYQFELDAVTLVPGSVIAIVDQAGTVIAHSPEPEIFVGTNVGGKEIAAAAQGQMSGWSQGTGLDGVDRIYGFATIASDRWHVYVGIPADAVLANVRAKLALDGLLALIILLVVLAGAYLISRQIAQPIRALAATAQAVTGGQLQARAPIKGPVEVIQVATDFNGMLDAREKAERTLRDSEEKYHDVFEGTQDILLMVDRVGNILDINHQAEVLSGYTQSELRTKNVFEHLIIPEDDPTIVKVLHDLTEGQRREYEVRWRAKDGRILHFAGASAPRFSPNGEFVSTICALRDITIGKQAELALRDSELRLRLVMDQLPMLLWTTDTDLRFTSNSGKGFQAVNLQSNQLVGQSVPEILHTTDPQFPAIQGHRQALEGKSSIYELEWSGRIYDAYVEPLRDDHANIIGCIGVALDVTERKQAEETLRRSEERFRALIENSLDAILLYSADGTTLYASPSIVRINGFSAQELVGKNRFDWIHPDDLERVRNEWSALIEQPGKIVTSQARGRHKDGSWLWIERIFHNLLDDPSVEAVVVNFRNVTDQKQAEEALRDSEVKFRGIFETAHSMILMVDRNGNILDVNGYAEEVVGYSPSELRQRNVFDGLYVPEDRPKMAQVIQDLTEGRNREYEVRWIAKDGHLVTFAGSSASRFAPDGEFLSTLCTYIDISERKRAEETLQRYAMRLETLHGIDQAILAAHSITEIGQAALHRVIDLVPSQRVGIVLLDPDARELIWVAVQGSGESKFAPGMRLPLEDARGGIYDLLTQLRRGDILVVNDIATLPQSPFIRTALEEGLRSLLCAPLRVQDNLIGMLNLWANQPARFGPEDADTVRNVADSLAVAITQMELFDKVNTGREQMRRLASRIVSAQEEERRHIAYELHDEIGQNLTAIKINLDLVDQLPPDQAQIRLTEAAKVVDELLNRIRNLSLDLRPAMLDDLGLLPSLQTFFERYTSQMNIQVLFKHKDLDQRFAAEVESAAYRIVQEALTNIARYARVSEATVRLWVDQGQLSVQIEDHGVGFDVNAAFEAPNKSGLIGMRERATLLGGQLIIESSPASGTLLTAELPVDR